MCGAQSTGNNGRLVRQVEEAAHIVLGHAGVAIVNAPHELSPLPAPVAQPRTRRAYAGNLTNQIYWSETM
jgi:hypothetical protein